jgi:hypothetical protein
MKRRFLGTTELSVTSGDILQRVSPLILPCRCRHSAALLSRISHTASPDMALDGALPAMPADTVDG